MRLWAKRIGLAAVVLLLAIQFIPVNRSNPTRRPIANDLRNLADARGREGGLRAVLQELPLQ